MQWKNPIGSWTARPLRRYAVAVAVLIMLALMQYAAQPVLGRNAPLGLLLVAVVFNALYGGGGPALLATALSVVIGAFFFLDPKMSFAVAQSNDRALLGFFTLLGISMSSMGWMLQRARRTSYELMSTLEEREHTLKALLESTTQAVLGIDRDGKIRMVNKVVYDVFGYRPQELIGQASDILIAGAGEGAEQATSFMQYCMAPLPKGAELQGRRKDGSLFPIEVTFSIAEVRSGALVVTYVADITERKQAAESLLRAARHDPLTDLPNRALVYELGTQILRIAARNQTQVAVLFFDLDRFKPINDTYGHVTGDRMLQEVAQRLRRTVRASDLVGRLGGDEFIAILPDVSDHNAIVHAASTLLKRLGEPYRIDVLELRTSPSIGISVFPHDGTDLDILIGRADAAMYHAKTQGRNAFQFFTEAINRDAEKSFAVEQGMRQSVERGDFELWYQPIVNTRTMQVAGAEALIRWRRDDAEPLLPGEFIPVAESSGLIKPIGDWVLQEACRQHEQWRRAGLPPLRIAINVSPLQFRARDFHTRVRDAVRNTGVNPSCIELELTESTIMKQVEQAADILAGLKDLGLRIVLDDFGTGYSSLSYLTKLPIDKLKVDQSFVRAIDSDPRSLAVAETVIALAKKLDVEVVAEGIESQRALDILRERGCDLGQGYLISKPLRPEHFAAWYREAGPQRVLH